MRKAMAWSVKLVLALLGLVLSLALLWRAPDRAVETLEARWAPPPSQWLGLDGLRVHFRDEGPRDDPHPLLLLHGTSASLHTWEGWIAALRPTRRVISVDLPGFGLTGPFPHGDYRLPRYVAFVTALLDARGVDEAVLIGNSFGAQVALETAIEQPARVAKLVLVDALAYPRQPESMPLGFRMAQMPGVNRVLEYVLPRALIAASVRDVYGNPAAVTPALVDRYYELTLRAGNRAALPERFRHLPTEADAARIPRIRQPTLILWGGRDRLIPPADGERLARDIAGSRLVTFPTLGHVPQEEDPAASLAPVLDFLAE